MVVILITVIQFIARLILIVLVVDAILSFVLSPWHPVRAFLDRLVQPMLGPIRRVVPPVGAMDFSPLIIIVLVQILESVLVNLLLSLR
jgi:YggT family protein